MTPEKVRLAPAMGASMAVHAILVLLGVFLIGTQSVPVVAPSPPARTKFVYVQQSGELGGGGGSSLPAAPRPVEVPLHRPAEVVPVAAPLVPEPPLPVLDAPVLTNSASLLQATGTTSFALPGPGGGGRGSGLGDGLGPGVGPGAQGGTGGGPRALGAGITPPVPVYQAKPRYTAAAMQAKLSGEVLLEIVVLGDGSVGAVRVLRSLDRRYGLDEEAIRTAKLWRFEPATAAGKPVDVIVQLALVFRLY
jgi:protein TonB